MAGNSLASESCVHECSVWIAKYQENGRDREAANTRKELSYTCEAHQWPEQSKGWATCVVCTECPTLWQASPLFFPWSLRSLSNLSVGRCLWNVALYSFHIFQYEIFVLFQFCQGLIYNLPNHYCYPNCVTYFHISKYLFLDLHLVLRMRDIKNLQLGRRSSFCHEEFKKYLLDSVIANSRNNF